MKLIKLTKGKFAQVDDESNLEVFTWHCTTAGYAARRQLKAEGGYRKIIYMHRQITKAGDSLLDVDHINGDKLDNRIENLRLVTHAQNMLNWDNRRGTSIYRGVSWNSERNKWKAQIQLNNKNKPIGRFNTEIEAAKAYDLEAKKLFGEFARLNFKENA